MTIRAWPLIGHSNSGKSPLGMWLATHSPVDSRRFFHLDFGSVLRALHKRELDLSLHREDYAYIDSIMQGALLDDSHFYLATAIVDWFCARHGISCTRDTLLLNGLPRHTGQAAGLKDHGIDVERVVLLECSPQTALVRKKSADAGTGHEDRSTRNDNDIATFARKIDSFNRDTRPVLEWYRLQSVPIFTIGVTPETTAQEMAHTLLSG